jgi:arylformamidase
MARFDPDRLDRQYDNRARHPEHPAIFERWARASALSRDGLSRRIDVPYGDGPNETLDIFPAARAGAPVLVFIHGGWWRSLDKSQHSFLAPTFVHAGAMVVVPNYALCPGTRGAPVGIDFIALQMVKALAWVWRNAALYGGDPLRIIVAGHSAGGHLAAMLLNCEWPQVGIDLPPHLVRGALAVSGVFDLEPVRRAPFLADDLRLTPALAAKLSPVAMPAPNGVLCAVVGADESEEFLLQNDAIRIAWGERAVPVCERIPGTHHFTVLHELASPGGRLNHLARQLLGLG